MLSKIMKDKYYRAIYEKYQDINKCINAGFFDDSYNTVDYKLNIPTPPLNKLQKGKENPIVLLTTGGFYPLHNGHIHIMEAAKKCLEESGYDVIGGFFSPCNDSYTKTKQNFNINKYERIKHCFEVIDSSEWLNIDTWECLYMPKTVNFTDVINRLELYLKRYFDKNIKVAYVFGGDNAEFMYCFENIGIGVCVNRDYTNEIFYKTKASINSKNCFFIEADEKTSGLSSKQFREPEKKETYPRSEKCYLVRDEGIIPFKKLADRYGEEKVKINQKIFLNKIKNIFREYICDDVDSIDINIQISEANKKLAGRKTISLDMFFSGDYNVRSSRLFNMDWQKKCIDLIQNNDDIKNVPSGYYTLVDDDSVSGSTIKLFKEKLPEDVIIDDIYLLMSSIKRDVFDVVDLRDFIIGSYGGGLMIQLPNGQNIRAPYIRPFVCLNTRASLPPEYESEVSKKILELNIDFYSKLDKNIRLKDVDDEFLKLMTYFGFKEDDNLINILEYYKENLY